MRWLWRNKRIEALLIGKVVWSSRLNRWPLRAILGRLWKSWMLYHHGEKVKRLLQFCELLQSSLITATEATENLANVMKRCTR